MAESPDVPPHSLSPAASALALATAYQVSQAVFAAVRLGIADALGQAATSTEIARATGGQPDMMQRLLRALAAFGVVEDRGEGGFALTPVGQCLRADAPGSVRSLVLMYGSEPFWLAAAKTGECVTTGQNAFQLLYGERSLFGYMEKDKTLAQVFNAAMGGYSATIGVAAIKAYDFAGIGHVVDVGGGHGMMLAAILKRHPGLRGTLFDLPRVVEGAPALLSAEGIADRCSVVGGDMFASVPAGGDLYLLSHVVHNWDDARAPGVLGSCRKAMAPGARLLVLDRVMPERMQVNPVAQDHALMDLRMMGFHGRARERTANELTALIEAAGLRPTRIIATDTPDSLIEAVAV